MAKEYSLAGIKVGIGTTFHSAYADSNPLWRVIEARGKDTWTCEVDKSSLDWAGTKKVFGTEEITRSLALDKLYDGLQNQHQDFWSSRRVGEVLHYHNSFGQYVRGTVVIGEYAGRRAKVLKPTALVGLWKDYDLPRWTDFGTYIDGCYSVKQIRNGETFQPNESSIWESPNFVRPMGQASEIDPTVLKQFDLSRPEPTPAQAKAAELYEILQSITEAARGKEGVKIEDWPAEYRKRLREVSEIVSRLDDTFEQEASSLKP